MNNQIFHGEYISRFCWKCHYQNNFAVSPICRNCGVYLKTAKTLEPEEKTEEPAVEPVTKTRSVKPSTIVIMVAVVLVCGGVLYIYFTTSFFGFQKTTETGASVELPPDAWYQPSIWNLYRRNPTVSEILDKNIQASSKAKVMSETQTLLLKGDVSFARFGCYTEQCLMEEYKRELASVKEYNRQVLASGNKSLQMKSMPLLDFGKKPQFDDKFNKPAYEEAGKIEIYVKNQNRIWQNSVFQVKDEPEKKVELKQGINGSKGWRRNIVSNRENIIESTLVDLVETELEEVKNTSSTVWKKASLKEENLKFSHRAVVNDAVHFAVEEGKDTLYFDSITGYLSKIEMEKMTCFLNSYVDYGDLKLPSALYYRIIDKSGNLIWMKVENLEWRVNESIEDSIFEKPIQ
jgi:hypothetical protein